MARDKKNLYRTKTNPQGKTVFDGSVAQDGKQVPSVAPTSHISDAPSALDAVTIPIVKPEVYSQLRALTGEQLDWMQASDDYVFGIQDIWDNLNAHVEPNEETRNYFEEKATLIAETELGKDILREDLILFEKSDKEFAPAQAAILKAVLVQYAEELIREHKPVYDLGELEERHQIAGYEELYCSVCEKCSYPCLKVQEALGDLPYSVANGLQDEMVNLAEKEGQEKWDSYDKEFSLIAVEGGLKHLGIKAFTANTGGGCATIYLGDPNAEGYYLTAGGPGSFQGSGNPVGYFDDFYIGPDEESLPDAPSAYSGERTVEGIVAALADAFNRALG